MAKVGIDPGHGGRDPGALGISEKDINLGIALHLNEALKRHGIDRVMTRTNDVTVSLKERTDFLNKHNVDLAVSIHVNSSTKPSADYISTFVLTTTEKAYNCAILVQREIVKVTGFTDGGVRTKNLHMLRETKMPAVLIEAGFISNPQQRDWLSKDENQKALAEGICKGICGYFGIPYKEVKKVQEVSSWAREARDWAVSVGITDGTRPKDNVTREEVWVMLYRFAKLFTNALKGEK